MGLQKRDPFSIVLARWSSSAAGTEAELESGYLQILLCWCSTTYASAHALYRAWQCEESSGNAGRTNAPSYLVGGCGEAGARLLLEVCGVRMRDSRQIAVREILISC